MKKQKFKPAKVVGVDVDGTLIKNGKLNGRLVDAISEWQKEGYEVFLWSARGKKYAQDVAKKFEVEELFSEIIGKPGYIVDDLGWGWTKYCRVVKGYC